MGLLLHQTKLSDFTSKENYLRYKMRFVIQDIKNDPSIDDQNYFEVTEIIVCNESYFEDEVSYEKYIYMQDYFIPSVKGMFEDWKRKYFKKVRNLYTSGDKIGFTNYIQNNFRQTQKTILSAQYLNLKQKAILIKHIRCFEEIMTAHLENPLPELKSKIEFNWNKHTLVYFFDLLRRNDVISKINDSDLGRIIDERFLYKDGDEYKIPKDSRKLFYALGDKGTKSSKRSYESLRELFLNPDFYNV
jgi:hypothetical protein